MPSPAAHRSALLGRARAATAWFAAASLAGVGLFGGLAALRHTSTTASARTGGRPAASVVPPSTTSDDGSFDDGGSDDGGSRVSLSPATTAPSVGTQPAHVSSGGTSHG